MATERSTFLLDETQIPTQWYNIVRDLPAPAAATAARGHEGADRS
jgi:predicted alternative tryptophan synthase beta-subunit